MTTLTITAKGQITLRRELLQYLGIAPGQQTLRLKGSYSVAPNLSHSTNRPPSYSKHKNAKCAYWHHKKSRKTKNSKTPKAN